MTSLARKKALRIIIKERLKSGRNVLTAVIIETRIVGGGAKPGNGSIFAVNGFVKGRKVTLDAVIINAAKEEIINVVAWQIFAMFAKSGRAQRAANGKLVYQIIKLLINGIGRMFLLDIGVKRLFKRGKISKRIGTMLNAKIGKKEIFGGSGILAKAGGINFG